ncbi:MAG: methylmalonyl-CoA epimerase [Pirellula sp.]|nr:methylmalonyl-CoA epimerase [Pirellula sp.]
MLTASLVLQGLNHLGIAVRDIAAARPFYEDVLGAVYDGEEVVEEQKVRVAFFHLRGDSTNVRYELLEPTSPDSPIAKFLEKRGPGLHHTAYTVDDVAAALAAAEAAGLRLIDREPRRGAHGAEIAFLHPASTGGMLIELCRPAPESRS